MSHPHQATVSIVIPFYNAASFLGAAIESVQAQTFGDWSLVLVDDGSSDESLAIAQSWAADPRVIVVSQNHAGIGAALNAGQSLASGPYFCWLDADDLWLPSKLERQLELLQSQPSVHSGLDNHAGPLDGVFVLSEQFRCQTGDQLIGEQVNPIGAMLRGTMMVTREAFQRVGPWPEHLKVGEFVDWYARAQEKQLRFEVIPQVLHRRRIHTSNTVTQQISSRKDYVKVLKAALDRRRQASPP